MAYVLTLPSCEVPLLQSTSAHHSILFPEQSDPGSLLGPSDDCPQLPAFMDAFLESLGLELLKHFSVTLQA